MSPAHNWEDVKRRVREARIAAGLPVRSPEEKQAAMHRLLAVRLAPATMLVLRNVPDETLAVLRQRAHRRGQSLSSYVRDLLEREAALPPR